MKSHKKAVRAVLIILAAALLLGVFVYLVRNRVVRLNPLFVSGSAVAGVDLSEYQAEVDMDRLAAQGVEFVYMRATEGSTGVDACFAANWENAGNSDLARGAYHFFSFDTPGATQARHYIDTVGDLSGSLIPAVDIEYYGDKKENPPDWAAVARELAVFLEALEAEYHVKPVLYVQKEIDQACLGEDFNDYPRWVRSVFYPVALEAGDDWLLWQYTDRGVLAGYSGGEKYIDLNVLAADSSLEALTVAPAEG